VPAETDMAAGGVAAVHCRLKTPCVDDTLLWKSTFVRYDFDEEIQQLLPF